jgi:cytochrome P450
MHELSPQPAMQSALREELMTLDALLRHPAAGGTDKISTATLRKLEGLSLLRGVAMETLRLHNPVLIPSRRVVPEGDASIDGYFPPRGVVIGTSAYSLHMNPDAYPEPTRWISDCWLDQQRRTMLQPRKPCEQVIMERRKRADRLPIRDDGFGLLGVEVEVASEITSL